MKTLAIASTLALIAGISSPPIQARAFAPYVDMTLWPTPRIDKMGVNRGIQQFALAFVVAKDGCKPSWGGVLPIPGDGADPQLSVVRNGITRFRDKGGEVMVSFGGANGTSLQQACASNASLQAAYQTVLDAYHLNRIDFNIEGAAQADTAANTRNFSTVAALQKDFKAKGKMLHVSLTLPAMPSGLNGDGKAVLNSALDNGVALDAVNLMTMDYGQAVADMGAAAKQAAQALYGQLDAAYKAHGLILPDALLWQKIGVTPMIGMNNSPSETFSVANAADLYRMADSDNFGLLSIWSINRDKPCPDNGHYVNAQCSGIEQTPYAFADAFHGFGEHWGLGVSQDPNYDGGSPATVQRWSADHAYQAGDVISYPSPDVIWETPSYSSRGDVPGQSPSWRQLSGPLQPWNALVPYQSGACALYLGFKYCSARDTQGGMPTSGAPWARAD
ncbi:chitinase [Chromobacterium sp. ATCC 53434]|uniref:chitinase n=1 Tax=Chromobacterium sp. (strain ATCC 53434 / SC 14030) TaxID=2059672 RepID=UPI001F201D0F|nr:chitinase [Chromobacterium sp. ATCC 53434]